jgi:VanZ family protein
MGTIRERMEDDQVPPSSQPKPSMLKTWGPPAAVAAVIVILSSIPGTAFPQHPDRFNSLAHFLEFGALSFLLSKAIAAEKTMGNWSLILISTVLCGTFGFLDEAHQFLVPYRVFDIMDLAYDIAGAFAGGTVFFWISRLPEDESGV